MPGRVILGVDFGDLKYFPPFKRGVFYCWYCMMHKWWALMTAAHSHLSSLCKLPSARNGLCPNKKQRSSAEYQPLGWAELWQSWKDCLVIDAASSFCDWLSDKIGAPCWAICMPCFCCCAPKWTFSSGEQSWWSELFQTLPLTMVAFILCSLYVSAIFGRNVGWPGYCFSNSTALKFCK